MTRPGGPGKALRTCAAEELRRGPESGWIILHDYLQVNGGAERLVLTLARTLPRARLQVSGIYPEFSGSADVSGAQLEELGPRLSWLPRIPRALAAFGKPAALPHDLEGVFYSGIYAPLAVRRQRSGLRVYYCHTPPRFALDQFRQYVQRAPLAALPLLRSAIALYRSAYLKALRQMDVVLTNSVHVQRRLLQQIGIRAEVVYPPIDTQALRYVGQHDFYLSVGRLEAKKRVDRVVRAFQAIPDKKLVVASGGSQLAMLKELAGRTPNIRFTGWLADKEFYELIGNAIAVIYVPEDEDYGMSAVEAMAAGKPVIAVDEGGIRESVIDGATGILLHANPAPADIADAVRRLPASVAAAMRPACEARAAQFSQERFILAIQNIVLKGKVSP